MKQWYPVLIILAIGLLLLITGGIAFFTESIQMIIKKLLLVSLWYFSTYVIRLKRIGHIEWNDENKRLYYFILLIGSALIFAWG